nr:YetF domain-containing protein [Tahibacter caeni]
MVLVRMSGKRTVGEFTPFDLVVVILIGESTQGALTGGDESVVGALVASATLITLNYLVGFLTTRFKAVDKLIEGEAVVLVRDGRLLGDALRRNNVPESDLEQALRAEGILDRDEVHRAFLEVDGTISVVRRKAD